MRKKKAEAAPEFTGNAGLLHAGACSSLPSAEVTRRMNMEFPTGINSKWRQIRKLGDGTKVPCPCPDHPKTHKHYAFEC